MADYPFFRPVTTRSLTITGTSQADTTGTGTSTKVVRLLCDTACWVNFNAAAAIAGAANTGFLLSPNYPDYFLVSSGDKVNVIGTSGHLSITELSR